MYDLAGIFRTQGPKSQPQGQAASLRLLRVMKILKMLRFVRVIRTFRELRVITLSMLASVRSTFWAVALVLMITFLFALVFVQGVAIYLASKGDDAHPDIKRNWASVGGSMFTLFVSATGGDDWAHIAMPMFEVGRWYYYLFCLYITFFLFIVSNILTSLFVDHALRAANNDDSNLIEDHLSNMEELVKAVGHIFDTMEKDDEGNVSVEEFKRHLQEKRLMAFAVGLDVEPYELFEFFKALSGQCKRGIDLETFVLGCIKLRGFAKSADLMHVIMAHEKINADNEVFKEFCEKKFDEINTHLNFTHDVSQVLQHIGLSVAAHTKAFEDNQLALQQIQQSQNDFSQTFDAHVLSMPIQAGAFGNHHLTLNDVEQFSHQGTPICSKTLENDQSAIMGRLEL